jgi:hypothetical protein
MEELPDGAPPPYAICLDTLSGTNTTIKVLFHNNHYVLLPKVLTSDFKICATPPGWALKSVHKKKSGGGFAMGSRTKHTLSRPERSARQNQRILLIHGKIDRLLLNIFRADSSQNDQWSVVSSVAAMEGTLGFLELRCMSAVNQQWYAKSCWSNNLRRVDMSNCEIGSVSYQMRNIILTICEKCPRVDTIDLTGCLDQDVIPALSTLIQAAVRRHEDTLQPKGEPMRAVQLYNTLMTQSTRWYNAPRGACHGRPFMTYKSGG